MSSLSKKGTSHFVSLQLFYHHRQCYRDFNTPYIEGSKTGSLIGSVAVFNNMTMSEKLHSYYNVFTLKAYVIF